MQHHDPFYDTDRHWRLRSVYLAELETIENTIHQIESRGSPASISLLNKKLDLLCKTNNCTAAKAFFKKLEQSDSVNIFTITIMFSVYVKSGELQEAKN